MGSALLSQWVEGPEAITVVDPAGSEVPDGVTLVTDRAAIADQRFDLVIAAVKPQLIDDILADYTDHLAPGGYVLSIAAGYSAGRLSQLMGDAPVIRTMPNLPAAIGRGVSGICPGPHATSDHVAHAEAFMRRAGATITVAGNIPGVTQTLPLAMYSRILLRQDAAAMQLAAVAIGMAVATLLVHNWFLERAKRRAR